MGNPNSHPRDVQQANARCARSAHSRPGAQGKAKPAAAAAMVAADDVGGNTFSFRRAEAWQCAKYTSYPVPPSSAEALHFLPYCSLAVTLAQDTCQQPFPLLDAIAARCRAEASGEGERCLKIEAIQYGQLFPVRDPPPVEERTPKVDASTSLWQSFTAPITFVDRGTAKTVTRRFVLSPEARCFEIKDARYSGTSFEVTLSAACDFDFTADGEPADGLLTYGVHISLQKRGKAHCYLEGQTVNDSCVKVSFGEVDLLGTFSAWYTSPTDGSAALDCVMVKDDSLRKHIFDQKLWPRHIPEREEEGSEAGEAIDPLADRPKRIRPRYDFFVIEEETCIQVLA